jgi:hypothetical protein
MSISIKSPVDHLNLSAGILWMIWFQEEVVGILLRAQLLGDFS